MKKNSIALVVSLNLMIQPVLNSVAIAQSVKPAAEDTACMVSESLKLRLKKEIIVENQKITQLSKNLSLIINSIEKENDNSTTDSLLYRLNDLGFSVDYAMTFMAFLIYMGKTPVYKPNAIVDLKKQLLLNKKSIEESLFARQVLVDTMAEGLSSSAQYSCRESIQNFGNILNQVFETRTEDLKSLVFLAESLAESVPQVGGHDKWHGQIKNSQVIASNVLATTMTTIMVGALFVFDPKGKIEAALRAVYVATGVAGLSLTGVAVYSQFEIMRENKKRKAALEDLKNEVLLQTQQLEEVQNRLRVSISELGLN